MSDNITNFITNFQDMLISSNTTIDKFPDNITVQEVGLILLQLQDISKKVSDLTTLTSLASEDAYVRYKALITSLENKISYINDTANVLLKINTFYNNKQILDMYNYDLRDTVSNGSIIYDDLLQGLTLDSKCNLFNCPKGPVPIVNPGGVDTPIMVFYNTNSCYHTGFKLVSPYLSSLTITSVSVIEANGTTISIKIPPQLDVDDLFFHHDILTSTQIQIQFSTVLDQGSITRNDILESLQLSLIEYEYEQYGYIEFPEKNYKFKDVFSYLVDSTLSANTFCNLTTTLLLKDINSNTIYTTSVELPIGNSVLCRRLSKINYDNIESLIGIYINNYYSADNLSIEYLKTLDNSESVYVVYSPKLSDAESATNLYITINDTSIKTTNPYVQVLNITTGLEMYSFSKYVSPILQTITGVSKVETL